MCILEIDFKIIHYEKKCEGTPLISVTITFKIGLHGAKFKFCTLHKTRSSILKINFLRLSEMPLKSRWKAKHLNYSPPSWKCKTPFYTGQNFTCYGTKQILYFSNLFLRLYQIFLKTRGGGGYLARDRRPIENSG